MGGIDEELKAAKAAKAAINALAAKSERLTTLKHAYRVAVLNLSGGEGLLNEARGIVGIALSNIMHGQPTEEKINKAKSAIDTWIANLEHEPARAPTDNGPEALSPPAPAAKAASSIGASGETTGAASPLASEAGTAEVVPAEHAAGAQAAPSVPGAGEAAPAPADDGAKERPPAPTREAVQAAPSIDSSARSAALPDDAEAARLRVRAEHQQATGPAASDANGQAAHPLAPAQETAQATAAAPPRTPAGEVEIEVDGVTARINWIDWLTGAQRYPRHWVIKAGEKAFKRHFSSKCGLLRKLVLECKMVAPDQLCPELAFLVSKLPPRTPRPARWEARP
jgi:hypothetical protein